MSQSLILCLAKMSPLPMSVTVTSFMSPHQEVFHAPLLATKDQVLKTKGQHILYTNTFFDRHPYLMSSNSMSTNYSLHDIWTRQIYTKKEATGRNTRKWYERGIAMILFCRRLLNIKYILNIMINILMKDLDLFLHWRFRQ